MPYYTVHHRSNSELDPFECHVQSTNETVLQFLGNLHSGNIDPSWQHWSPIPVHNSSHAFITAVYTVTRTWNRSIVFGLRHHLDRLARIQEYRQLTSDNVESIEHSVIHHMLHSFLKGALNALNKTVDAADDTDFHLCWAIDNVRNASLLLLIESILMECILH